MTVARIGYRFAAPVQREAEGATDRTRQGESADEKRPSRLLILPFRFLRDDAETGFLAFSVPDAVINALSGLQSLVVRSSAVSARFKEEPVDLSRIAVEASVDAVLTGTFLRSGQQLRLTAQLLAVPCGTVLWSDSIQVTLSGICELQDRLVGHVVRSLAVSLTAHEQRRLRHDVPASPAAYEFFLRANEAIGPQGIASSLYRDGIPLLDD